MLYPKLVLTYLPKWPTHLYMLENGNLTQPVQVTKCEWLEGILTAYHSNLPCVPTTHTCYDHSLIKSLDHSCTPTYSAELFSLLQLHTVLWPKFRGTSGVNKMYPRGQIARIQDWTSQRQPKYILDMITIYKANNHFLAYWESNKSKICCAL